MQDVNIQFYHLSDGKGIRFQDVDTQIYIKRLKESYGEFYQRVGKNGNIEAKVEHVTMT